MWKRVELFGWARHIPNWQSVSFHKKLGSSICKGFFLWIICWNRTSHSQSHGRKIIKNCHLLLGKILASFVHKDLTMLRSGNDDWILITWPHKYQISKGLHWSCCGQTARWCFNQITLWSLSIFSDCTLLGAWLTVTWLTTAGIFRLVMFWCTFTILEVCT